MSEERKDRDAESRKAESRKSDSWIQPSQLPMPYPRDGWAFHYIRTATLGVADVRNVSRKFREGWEPVIVSDFPELSITSDVGSKYPDGIEIGGLLLCKMPIEKVEQRNKHFEELNTHTLQSVDEGFMKEQDPRMPKHNESTSRTQFRKG